MRISVPMPRPWKAAPSHDPERDLALLREALRRQRLRAHEIGALPRRAGRGSSRPPSRQRAARGGTRRSRPGSRAARCRVRPGDGERHLVGWMNPAFGEGSERPGLLGASEPELETGRSQPQVAQRRDDRSLDRGRRGARGSRARRCRGGRTARWSSRRRRGACATGVAGRRGGTSAPRTSRRSRRGEAHHVGDPLVPAERRHLAEHAVAVRLGLRPRGSSPGTAPAEGRAGRSADRPARACSRSAQRRSRRATRRRRSPSTRSVASTRTRPRSSSGSPNSREEGGRLDAGRPDERPGRHGRAVRQDSGLAVVREQRLVDVNLDPSPLEAAGRVGPEPPRDVGEDRRGGVDEHPALAGVTERRVVAAGPPVQDRATPRAPRLPHSPRRRRRSRARSRAPGSRSLEPLEHVVAECDRVGQILEAAAVLDEARHGEDPRDGPECHHEPLVCDDSGTGDRLCGDRPACQVDRGRAAEQQLGMWAHLPERHDDVARLEGAGGRLGEQGGVEHRVLGREDRRAGLAEQASDVGAGEATAENQRSAVRRELPGRCHPGMLAAGAAGRKWVRVTSGIAYLLYMQLK